MKRLLLTMISLQVAVNAICQTQPGKYELSLGSGVSWMFGYDKMFSTNLSSCLMAIGSLKYQITHGFAIDVEVSEKTLHHVINSEIKLLSILPGIVITYYDRPGRTNLKLYGSVLQGINYDLANDGHDSDVPSWLPAFPATKVVPLGVRIGRSVGGFMELGFGWEFDGGTLQYASITTGLSFRF